MRIAFALLLFVHALIHLVGLAKALYPEAIPQLSRSISRTAGFFWLFASGLLLIAFLMFILKKEFWPYFALVGAGVSQVLITLNWGDAKFGSLVNILILGVALAAIGNFRFQMTAQKETVSILQKDGTNQPLEDLHSLPPIVQKWMENSGAITRTEMNNLRLEQKGSMRIKRGGKWMPFSAVQFFNVQNPAFIWTTAVDAFPAVRLLGRDKLEDGRGEMRIALFGFFNLVNAKGDHKIDSGSLQRFLGEICWFPPAALKPYIHWESLSPTAAKAILTQKDMDVEGIFTFSPEGELLSFQAERFYGTGEEAKKEEWLIEIQERRNFDGITVPSRCKVTWKLKEGDFHWLNLELTDLRYDVFP